MIQAIAALFPRTALPKGSSHTPKRLDLWIVALQISAGERAALCSDCRRRVNLYNSSRHSRATYIPDLNT